MKIPTYITQGLISAGFIESNKYKETIVFRTNEKSDKELFQFFSPHILYYNEGRVLAGIIGSMEESIEVKNLRSGKLDEKYTITCYSSNFPSLRNPPIIGIDQQKDLVWYKNIYDVVVKFPRTTDELLKLVEIDADISGVRLSKMNIFRDY